MKIIEEKDYGQARSYADSIKTNADNINDIFNKIDSSMGSLFNSNWLSSGSENSYDRYLEISKNYKVFYEQVQSMHKHVHDITDRNEEADKKASSMVSNVG